MPFTVVDVASIVASPFVTQVELNEIVVAEGAHVMLDKIQNENSNTVHIGADFAIQQKDSVFTINTIPANAKLIRNNLNIINCS